MSSIIDALNRCYNVNENRPFWKRRLVALGLTVAIAILTIWALMIVLYGGDIAEFVGGHIGLSSIAVITWKVVQWPVALFFVVWSFGLVFAYLLLRTRFGRAALVLDYAWLGCRCAALGRSLVWISRVSALL